MKLLGRYQPVYPQSTFYPLSDGPLPYRTTGSLRTYFSYLLDLWGLAVKARFLPLYSTRDFPTTAERTFVLLRLLFRRRDRPSQNYPPDTVPRPRITGTELETSNITRGGISRDGLHWKLAFPASKASPPILHK